MVWQPGGGIYLRTTSAASAKYILMVHVHLANILATNAPCVSEVIPGYPDFEG